MSLPKPYYDDGRGIVIYHGDALDVLEDISEGVDSVITDPPYASGTRKEAGKPSSGAMLRGERWREKPIDLDQMTTTGFVWLMRQVGLACYPLLQDGSSFLSFIDWRQWPNLVGALETCNYRVQQMVVWDKGSMGLGNGFRAQHELVCHAAKGTPSIFDRSCGNVLGYKRSRPIDHPSPKPVDLMQKLIAVVTPPGGVVLDPFMGAGSTMVGASLMGRKFIGIEREEKYCEIAVKRLSQEVFDFGGEA